MAQNIILTGFMGTGKTTAGKKLAERLGYEFVDTDAMIEEQEGRSIPTIFAGSGEAYFRSLERTAAAALANREGLVISTGGRLMLDRENAAVLMRSGRVFCLTAEPETILARLSKEGRGVRPLLAVPDPERRIAELLAERREGYAQFEQVATDGRGVTEVVEHLLTLIIGS